MIRLGLIIPADFDQRVAGAQEIVVKGYAAHSADSEQIEEWAVFFEEQIGLVSGENVRVDLDEDMLYPRVEAGGQVLLAATLVVVVIMAMGFSLVPLLIVEEKEAHTLDSLLVTPAGYLHVIAGKALTGFVYCLVAAVVLFFVYQPLFVSTGILLVAILTTIAFVVAGGLFIGMLSDNPTTTGMWGALLLLILIASAVLVFVSQAGMPAGIQSIANWMPGSLMVNLVRAAMAGKVTAAQWLVPAAKLTAEAGLVYLLVVWLLRRQDR
jgi:ABC-type multidrug transport system permease subunit